MRKEDLHQEVEVHDSLPLSNYKFLLQPTQLWAAIVNTALALYLHSILNIEQYELAVRLFHTRLGLIVCGLSTNQLLVFNLTTNLEFATTANKSDKEQLLKLFEIAVAWTEDQIICKMKQYAIIWYKTLADLKYAKNYQYAK